MEQNYTLRKAFKRWLVLHHEEHRMCSGSNVRIPGWFHYYILKNTDWKYTIINEYNDRFANLHELDCNERRRFKGYYSFCISDEELLNLQRPKWIMTKDDMRRVIELYFRFNHLEKNIGIYEFHQQDGKSLGISYEDIEEDNSKREVYIYNIFVGSEYINISGKGTVENPLPDNVLDELVTEWNKY